MGLLGCSFAVKVVAFKRRKTYTYFSGFDRDDLLRGLAHVVQSFFSGNPARSELLDPLQLDRFARDVQPGVAEPSALAAKLVERGWLTRFQAEQLLRGRSKSLLLGHYVILRRLGGGGMGSVYQARHKIMRRVVALKVIRRELLENPDAVRRFRREIRAAARLSHPNIISAHDAGMSDNHYFLVMEFLEGRNLFDLVKERGPLPAQEVCDYVRQASLGLQHAHERGLVHRDIKPSNLFLSFNESVVKILDLGLARLSDIGDGDLTTSQLTPDGATMGSVDYMSPEQGEDSHTVDIRSDIYSLGCSMYFLFSGKVPFPVTQAARKLAAHRQAAPPAIELLRPDVPPQLPSVLCKMMAKRPQDRYQTPGEVAVALTPFCSVPSIASRPPAGKPGGPTPASAANPPESDSDLDDHFSIFDSLVS